MIQSLIGIGSMNDWSCHCIWFPCIILVPVASFLYHRHAYRVMASEVSLFPIVTYNGPCEYNFRQSQQYNDCTVNAKAGEKSIRRNTT